MALECYFISGSPFAWRVLLALSLKGLSFDAIELHSSKGDNKTSEYLEMNPRGKVPVLKDGELTMYESLAILAYLERNYPETPLFGETVDVGTLIWQRTMEIENYFLTAVGGVVRPVFLGAVDGNEEAINDAIVNLKAELGVVEAWLAEGDFLAGDSVSAVDITFYPSLAIISRVMGAQANDKIDCSFLPLSDNYPAITSWMERMEALEGFDAVYPPHWREAKAAE